MRAVLLLLLLAQVQCEYCTNYDGGVRWLDMLGWVSAGKAPRWEVADGGRTVTQYVNSPYPGFYVSDKGGLMNVVLAGTLAVLTDVKDDDMIGIAVGYEAPMPGNLTTFDNLLFAWGGHGGLFAPHDAATVQRLNGFVDFNYSDGGHGRGKEKTCFFSRNPDPVTTKELGCFTPIPANTAEGGWERNKVYTFSVLYTDELFYVNIDGVRKLSFTRQELFDWCDVNIDSDEDKAKCKSWKKGKIAFYNYSQNGVRYGNVKIFDVNPATAGTVPVVANDIYTIMRTGDVFQPLTVPDYEGILVNDFSPILDPLSIVLGNDTVPDAGITISTALGGSVKVLPLGGFTYTPPASTTSTTDTFKYYVSTADEASALATVTFSLPPPPAQLEGFALTWLEEHSTDISWYDNLAEGSAFGKVQAEGGCGLIVDWKLLGGGAQGRFTLAPGGSHGAVLSVADPKRVAPGVQDQVYTLEVEATDVFNQTATLVFYVTVPSSECSKCPEHSTCTVTFECVCDEDYFPPDCQTYCPGGACNSTAPESEGVEDSGDSCSSFLVDGKCIGWVILLFSGLAVMLCATCFWAYHRRGRKTISKRKGAKLKSFEIDQHLLEDQLE